ncbi:alpha-amylase family protein [Glycomyces sp. TRM65418]|uniref:alpha-amylase family protein n=1 Tax=Glycomyces sp. TRM65418 TaxID=2867006 RepID=UPI001CE4D39D|nr:alpha-amylase family protein [Glycomyces sp. TRM65418]MCC3761674.1 alpha-amylase family protein [Glycomyces sp. TRM65418]QZD55768.1 alpha-amylase family protein [Glycomyces sp. TRM65418]
MQPLWYRNAVIYAVDPAMFRDSDGDGWGDLRGITDRLDHLRGLGVTCLWLLPFYPSPFRDGGYDITDHLGVDPRFGALPDVVELLEEAEENGIRVLLDLVVQHTSDQHPWFQEARSDPESPYRDYYIWSDEPKDTGQEPIFPTVEDDIWTWDEQAGQYYRHVFYSHEPDLNHANPAVRREIRRIMSFWLRLGVSGFRVDAVPYMVEAAGAADPHEGGAWLLREMRELVSLRHPEAVLMGEVDVPIEEYNDYFCDGRGMTMLLNFWLNNHMFLALARGDAEPVHRALDAMPQPPHLSQYANWLRNHDELDLERLSDAERAEVIEAFAPDEDMRLYGRGIRRRLAPILGGDERRIAAAHALLLSLPGAPVLQYGDEIGMGDDLSRRERLSVRIPMQWSSDEHAGFSSAPSDRLVAEPVRDGPFGYREINVYDQQRRPHSLLSRIGDLVRARHGLRQIGFGRHRVIDTGCRSVVALRHQDDGDGVAITLVNLSGEDVKVQVPDDLGDLVDVMADSDYPPDEDQPRLLRLRGHGYRWMRPRASVFD